MTTHTATLILCQTLAIFLFICALIGIAVSLLLIFKPHLMARINLIASSWVPTRRLSRLLDSSISIEQWFYRHHRPFGIFITLGACYMLVYFGLLFDKPVAMRSLAGYAHPLQLDLLIDAMVLIALVCAVLALLVGLFLWLRPSMLSGIEDKANQWITLRRATKALDIPRDDVENFVAQHAQRVGWLLLLGSIYLLFALMRILM